MAPRKPVLDAPPLPTREQWNAWVHAQAAANPGFVPPDQLCQEDIGQWESLKDTLASTKSAESLLRGKLVKSLFAAPEEGTNKVKLADGAVIELQHKIDRSVDEEKLATFLQYTVGALRSWLMSLNIDCSAAPDDQPAHEFLKLRMDELIVKKPTLSISAYRTLTAEQMAVFDSVLDIKPGSPQVKIVRKE